MRERQRRRIRFRPRLDACRSDRLVVPTVSFLSTSQTPVERTMRLTVSPIILVLIACMTTAGQSPAQTIRKPRMSDTVKANVYADNAFKLYINGELVAVDSIKFVPHNVVSVDVLPKYPMTIAAMGIDNADPKTGMEYADTNIGDGGFILKLGDGTVTDATWKAKRFSWGPIDGDTKNPRVKNLPIPENWFAEDFDDGDWSNAKVYSQETVGPKEPFFEHDFEGAKFIWSGDVLLDNTVIFRKTIKSPPDGKEPSRLLQLDQRRSRESATWTCRWPARWSRWSASRRAGTEPRPTASRSVIRIENPTVEFPTPQYLKRRSMTMKPFLSTNILLLLAASAASAHEGSLAHAVAGSAGEDPAAQYRSVGSSRHPAPTARRSSPSQDGHLL